MDQQEGLATNRPPLFTGDNYAYWSVRMKFHLMSLGYKFWRSVENVYAVSNEIPIDKGELSQYEANVKYLNAILSGLTHAVFVKVMQRKTSKHSWEKLNVSMKEHPKSRNPYFRPTKDSLKT